MSVRFERENSKSPSGVPLSRLVVWPESKPRGAVALVHGLGDHSARHEVVLRELALRGVLSVATDLPGHGKSGDRRGHIKSMEEAGALIDQSSRRAVELAGPCPVGLAAHSMGALVALDHFARGGGSGFDFVWLSSALVDPLHRHPRWRIAIGKALEKVFPRLRIGSGVRMDECYDSREVGISLTDELESGTHNRMSLRLGMELVRARERVQASAGELFEGQSLLMSHGDGDPVCPQRHARELFGKVAATDKKFLSFHTRAHEPWRNPDALTAIGDWVESQL